jgi:nitroreductase
VDVLEALSHRRTTGAFSDRQPPREVIERVIEAATWAPNHHLTEPWRFVVIAGDERRRFGDHLAQWLAAPPEGEPRKPSQIESITKKLLRSPVIIVIAQRYLSDDPVRDLEDYAACSAATQNLMLAAHAEGLATKWSTGELATLPPAREYLGLEDPDRIVAYVYLGYPTSGDYASPAERRPPEVAWRGLE